MKGETSVGFRSPTSYSTYAVTLNIWILVLEILDEFSNSSLIVSTDDLLGKFLVGSLVPAIERAG